jgi:predicted metal-dependent HD superfamily phosphohydrolase
MHLRRYNAGAFPRLVTLYCRDNRRYHFLKGIDG